jgi:raffinose/stachyose/melibiose transport system substrate-binding protein
MKNKVRLIVNSLIVISMLLVAAGLQRHSNSALKPAAQGETTQAPAAQGGEEQKLTIWINGRDSFIGPNEQQLPQDQWYISQAIKRFEAANPGVTIELVVQSDAYAAHQMFRTAGLAGNAPDIANLWSGQFTFPLAEVITPINDKIPQEDKDNLIGWDTVTVDFKTATRSSATRLPITRCASSCTTRRSFRRWG